MHKFSDDIVKDAVTSDPVGDFEKVTGKHWSQWDSNDQLGALRFAARQNAATRHILESNGDNAFGGSLESFERIVSDIGFQIALTVEFQDKREPRTEALKVWWFDELGILLQYDTYWSQTSVNSGNFFYNWRANESIPWEQRSGVTSSSCPCGDGIIAGGHDCREAMRFKISRLLENGEFIKPWRSANCAYLSLLHYADRWDDSEPMDARMAHSYGVGLSRAKMLPEAIDSATGLVAYFEAKASQWEARLTETDPPA